MNFELAIRLTEILAGFAFAVQSIEHLRVFRSERILFIPRLILAILLVAGLFTSWVIVALLCLALITLYYFDGPYNGGADRMSVLVMVILTLVHVLPSLYWREIALGYLAFQLVLSYFISGWVKLRNPQWRTGQALADVFLFSAYPVSESLREWAKAPRMLFVMSWVVMIFELMFPLALLSAWALKLALIMAALFHFSNALLFGLNRFFWIWLAAYPSIIWFQQRIFDTINT